MSVRCLACGMHGPWTDLTDWQTVDGQTELSIYPSVFVPEADDTDFIIFLYVLLMMIFLELYIFFSGNFCAVTVTNE